MKTKALVVAQSNEFKRAARATEIAFGMLATIAGHIRTTSAVSSCICTWVAQAERLPHSTSAGLAELLQGLCFLLGSSDQVRHTFNTLPANPPRKSFVCTVWSIISLRFGIQYKYGTVCTLITMRISYLFSMSAVS